MPANAPNPIAALDCELPRAGYGPGMEETPADSLQTRWSRIDRMERRDADAEWQWFFDRYRPFVTGVLAGMLRSRARAEQAAEEFWGYFCEHRIHEKADRGRRFRPFFAGVLRNFGRDWSRRSHVAQSSDPDAAPPEPAVIEALAEDEEMKIYARTLIHNALRRLASGLDRDGKPSHRPVSAESCRVLRLFYGIPEGPEDPPLEPKKASEIVRELGMTLDANAIHKRLHDTRARFREIVVDEVRETVPTRGDLEQELNLLFAAIQGVARGLVV